MGIHTRGQGNKKRNQAKQTGGERKEGGRRVAGGAQREEQGGGLEGVKGRGRRGREREEARRRVLGLFPKLLGGHALMNRRWFTLMWAVALRGQGNKKQNQVSKGKGRAGAGKEGREAEMGGEQGMGGG